MFFVEEYDSIIDRIILISNQLLPAQMESQSSPLHAWNGMWKLLSTDNFMKLSQQRSPSLIVSTHSSPTMEEFRDKDFGDRS